MICNAYFYGMKLFTPYTIREKILPNRIVLSPMCMYSAKDGYAQPFHTTHYLTRAVGGAGLIMMEATAVRADGRITPECLGIWEDAQAERLGDIVKAIHSQSASLVGIQLAHAGRKASCRGGKPLAGHEAWETVAPSAIAFREDFPRPHSLDEAEILSFVQSFSDAAKRAVNAGFDVIEIHAAHGYLIHEFLSPLSNHRTDAYGGSFDGRIRFLLEVCSAVRRAIGDSIPLFVRISATDYAEGGWDIEESIALCTKLREYGADIIDVSSGGTVHNAKITLFDGYQIPFAERIYQESGVPTAAVGLIQNAKQAEEILENRQAELVCMGRKLLRDPYFPLKTAALHGHIDLVPKSYRLGFPV